ncbi:MAG: sensor histidine kinase [Eubacteriaceae bacterium]|nr:sensor histidine kinase [Eubacteriaceae bacterium]
MLNKLRLNLAVLNTVVLTLILIAISGFLYITMLINIKTDVDSELVTASEEVGIYVNYFDGIREGAPRESEKDKNYDEIMQKLLNKNITAIIWNDQFEVIQSPIYQQMPDDILKDVAVYNFKNGMIGTQKVTNYRYGIIDMKIYTTSFVNTDGELRVVQTLKNMNAEVSFLNWLTRIIIISVIIGMTLSFFGGYFISGKSIIPVKNSIEKQQEFVANVSHELRTPLAVVQTNLEVVKSSGDESIKDQMMWINNAYDETKRMQKVVTDLLFLARADAGQLLLMREKFNLDYLVTGTCEKLMGLAARKNISIFTNIDDKIHLFADQNKMIQLIVILVDNSIKYSPEKTGITITSIKNKNFIHLTFKDQGIGISEKDLESLYERFFRADKVRSREAGGTGLGLSIAKWIADEHDWKINIASELGKGTTVTLSIPAEQTIYEEE